MAVDASRVNIVYGLLRAGHQAAACMPCEQVIFSPAISDVPISDHAVAALSVVHTLLRTFSTLVLRHRHNVQHVIAVLKICQVLYCCILI